MFSMRSFYIGLALFSAVIFTFQHDLIGKASRWAKPLFEQATLKIQDTLTQQEKQSRRITGFSHVAARDVSDPQLEDVVVWRSIFQSAPHPADGGEVLLSLIPLDECESAYIWSVTQGTFIQVETPFLSHNSSDVHWCVTQLGIFHGGLAPAAAVKYHTINSTHQQERSASRALWGYVDTQGKWATPPVYAEAGRYMGDIAIVKSEANEFSIINRTGHTIPWPPTQDSNYSSFALSNARMERFGKWVWISRQSLQQQNTYITDGTQTIALPGRVQATSPDGELWLLQLEDGPRLWKPTSGFITLPDNLTPVKPVTATTFTAPSDTGQVLALYSIDGNKLLDPTMIQQPLSPTRFIACTTGGPDSWYGSNNYAERKDRQCGITDEKGKWWANPIYQVIEPWGEHEIRLQTGKIACMADLRETSAPDCTRERAASLRVPLLDFDNTHQPYTYQSSKSDAPLPRYISASPFLGNVAMVIDDYHLAGLIDEQQQWLTPHLSSSLTTEAQILTTGATDTGTGLIDRTGKWVLPPVFGSIGRYPDGTLTACVYSVPIICRHLDTSGNPLPPTTEQILDYRSWHYQPDSTQGNAQSEPGYTDMPPPRHKAVALNGVWGFRDQTGKWLIEPRFDDAEDFFEERGAAAVIQDMPQDEESDEPIPESTPSKRIRWGIIDPSGNWVVEPRFDAIGVFKDGIAVASDGGGYGLIDEAGNWLIDPRYRSIGRVVNGYATAVKASGGNCLINVKDHIGCPDGVEMVYNTGDQFIVAKDGAAHFGYATIDGQWVIPPTFTAAYPFVGNFAAASTKLPELPAEERKKWMSVKAEPLHSAHLFAVTLKHRGESNRAPSRMALMDDSGRWLVPKRTWLSSLFPARSHQNDQHP